MYCNAQIVPAVYFSMYAGAFYMLDLIKHWTFQFEIVKLVYDLFFFSNDIDCSLESGQDSRCMTTSPETQNVSQKKQNGIYLRCYCYLRWFLFPSNSSWRQCLFFRCFSISRTYSGAYNLHRPEYNHQFFYHFSSSGLPLPPRSLNISIWVTLSWHVNCEEIECFSNNPFCW